MKRISSLVILVLILALFNGLAFADFDSNSANITNRYFPVQEGNRFEYIGYGNAAGETETWQYLGTEFVESVNCLKLEIGDATGWLAQDTDGNVWFLKIIDEDGVFTLGSGISNPWISAEPKVGDRLSHIFPESAGTYAEVTEIGVVVNLNTGLGPYENCIEITDYFDYEIEEFEYYCHGIGLVKSIYPQESPPETGQELSEFGLPVPDIKIPRYRLYNPNNFHHHYTTDPNEYNALETLGWIQEGTSCYLYNEIVTIDFVDAVPYYRLYNPNSFEHHWTTDANEYDVLGTLGWTQEGADGYVFASQVSGSEPLYRLYNPNDGLHHWTMDANEKNILVGLGFIDEGIACYVFP